MIAKSPYKIKLYLIKTNMVLKNILCKYSFIKINENNFIGIRSNFLEEDSKEI